MTTTQVPFAVGPDPGPTERAVADPPPPLFPFLGSAGWRPLLSLCLLAMATVAPFVVLVLHRVDLRLDLRLSATDLDRAAGLAVVGVIVAAFVASLAVRPGNAASLLRAGAVGSGVVALVAAGVADATWLQVMTFAVLVLTGVPFALLRSYAYDVYGPEGGWRIAAALWAAAGAGVMVVGLIEWTWNFPNWGYELAVFGVISLVGAALLPRAPRSGELPPTAMVTVVHGLDQEQTQDRAPIRRGRFGPPPPARTDGGARSRSVSWHRWPSWPSPGAWPWGRPPPRRWTCWSTRGAWGGPPWVPSSRSGASWWPPSAAWATGTTTWPPAPPSTSPGPPAPPRWSPDCCWPGARRRTPSSASSWPGSWPAPPWPWPPSAPTSPCCAPDHHRPATTAVPSSSRPRPRAQPASPSPPGWSRWWGGRGPWPRPRRLPRCWGGPSCWPIRPTACHAGPGPRR